MGRNERKNIELERTIPDLPENRGGKSKRSSSPPAKWKSFQVTPVEAPSIEPISKTVKQNPGPKQEERKQDSEADEKLKTDLADRLVNATIQGNFQKVNELVKEGADPNEKDSNGKTAMQYAGFMGKKQILEFFKSLEENK